MLPAENSIYVADSAYTPYGNRLENEIEQRVTQVCSFLVSKNVKAIVVACNTATAAAVNTLRNNYPIPIIGLEPALKPAAESTESGRVGVLATQATLNSKKYAALKVKFASRLQVVEKASPLFVELVEESDKISDKEFHLIQAELSPFVKAKVDSLVLGCTHYPFLTKAISEIMGPRVKLYESSIPVAKETQRRLKDNLNTESTTGITSYYSSAPHNAQAQFDRILGKKVKLLRF